MSRYVLFAFNGDPLCFVHVLLNALDLKEKGSEVTVILEGSATRLIPELEQEGRPLNALYTRARGQGLIGGVCRACSAKMGTLEAARAAGLELLGDMSGHPGMAGYTGRGWQVITF